jgi:transposase InsO family protein
VFADEVGFLMNPCIKATWAPVGRTPVVQYRNRHHQKVSALGAIALAADGALRVLIDWHPDSYVRAPEALAFVQRLLQEIPDGPIDLIWDNLSAHKSKLLKQWLADHPRLRIHYLPPYAPDLNPIETLWSTVKHHRMANHTIDNLAELESAAKRHVTAVAAEQRLLQACFRSAKLALNFPRAQ